MTSVFALLFISLGLGLATADVAHLVNSYLPPSRTVALPLTQAGFSGSRTSSFTSGGYSDRLVETVPATSYIAPATTSFQRTNSLTSYSAPAKLTAFAPAQTYIAPVSQNFVAQAPATATFQRTTSYSAPAKLTAFAPAQTYIAPVSQNLVAQAPAAATFQRTNSLTSYSAPARLTAFAPAAQAYTAPVSQNFVAQTSQNYASAPSAAYTSSKYTNAQFASPSREYLSPEVETFEPLVVQQSYTAPASSSAFTAGSSGLDTKYSADGGYVY